MTENKRFKKYIDKYEDVYIKTPDNQLIGDIGWEDDVDTDSINEIVNLLNEQKERIQKFEEENQELKRLIKKMGELGGFNKHMIKTIVGDSE